MNKILNIKNLLSKVKDLKNKRSKIVLCHGVFDLLHPGHINHFIEAKNLGDVLIVSITSDRFVNKGPGRPVFNEMLRAQSISQLINIDYVFINNEKTATNLISKIKPNFYCKGPDYKSSKDDITGEIINETRAVKKYGGRVYTTTGKTFSSSSIINQFNENISEKQKKSIKNIKANYNFTKISEMINNFHDCKILVIGEAIIDQYIFCDALGKSGKEPVLVLKEMNSEKYLGGALAIANHLSKFSKKVDLFSMIGQKKEYLNEIKLRLEKNIKLNYIRKKNSPTILKKRFLDYVSNNKILGVYNINDDPINKIDEKKINKTLKKNLSKYDLVIVSDYGHGFISDTTAKIISKHSKFLALNAQVNSSNIGYHSMKKYKNFECLVINEKEIRHEMRDRSSDLKILIKKLSSDQKIKNLIVTRGKLGAILFNNKKNIFKFSDAFAKKVVDKIGSGDAMLGIIALCLKYKFSHELSLLVGSMAGAISTETIGNKVFISKTKILKSIQHILK